MSWQAPATNRKRRCSRWRRARLAGCLAYIVFLGTFLYAIAFVGGFWVPRERGCGLSEWKGELSLDGSDLDAVIAASGATEPVTLLGISQGAATCISYAVRHPGRVARLVLYGGYAIGVGKRGSPLSQREYAAMVELTRAGWGRDNPTFRQVFTSRFIPDGSPEQIQWWNDLCRKTTTGKIAARSFEARANVDVSALLSSVRTPTLVLHARADEVISVREGRRLAAEIPGAEFVELFTQPRAPRARARVGAVLRCRPELHARRRHRGGRPGVCRTVSARAGSARAPHRRPE